MNRLLRRISAFLLALCCLTALPGVRVQAEEGQVLTGDAAAPAIGGEAGFLLEVNTGTVLFAQNADEHLYPASITKIMTALVAIENTEDFGDMLTFSDAAVNGIAWDSSRIGAMVGEQMTVEQALYGLMLKSGNDCAVALAEYVSGSEEAFCELMNARAAELGCTNTHFVNAHGLHDENHYTTAHDMALIMQAAIQNDVFHTIDSTVTYSVPWTNMHSDGFSWTMSNKMMNPRSDYYYEGVLCGKTGYTDQAGNTLVTCASRGDMYLICVVMKCPQTHYQDTEALFNYGFQNFTVHNLSTSANSLSYAMEGTNFFGDLDPIVGGSSFSIRTDHNYLILPNSVSLSDLTTELIYDDPETGHSDRTFATLRYTYQGTAVGEARLELVPETRSGFDFEKHENPVPETETQVVQEETKTLVINPLYIGLGLAAALAAILLTVFLMNFFSAKNRRIRQARKKRRELRNRRLNGTSSSQRSSLRRLHEKRRERIKDE